jgi:hypothetical protein
LERLSRGRTIWAAGRRLGPVFFLLVVALVAAAVIVGQAAAVILGFAALLLVLDRVIGFSPWAADEADRRFAQLMGERRRAVVGRRRSRRDLEPARLDWLDEATGWASTAQRQRLGIQEIPIVSIVGTVERDKANAFDREWRPPKWSRGHWTRLWLAARRGTALPPISVYRIGDAHYVRDGHHRVSVLRAIGAVHVDAEVTELCPDPRAKTAKDER